MEEGDLEEALPPSTTFLGFAFNAVGVGVGVEDREWGTNKVSSMSSSPPLLKSSTPPPPPPEAAACSTTCCEVEGVGVFERDLEALSLLWVGVGVGEGE